jgi:hypothetical protein
LKPAPICVAHQAGRHRIVTHPSPLKSWFESLHSKGGSPCCADADGTAIADADWDTRNGRYRMRLMGEWIDVPGDTVITEPNRGGRIMVCRMTVRGHAVTRCIMPGSMT